MKIRFLLLLLSLLATGCAKNSYTNVYVSTPTYTINFYKPALFHQVPQDTIAYNEAGFVRTIYRTDDSTAELVVMYSFANTQKGRNFKDYYDYELIDAPNMRTYAVFTDTIIKMGNLSFGYFHYFLEEADFETDKLITNIGDELVYLKLTNRRAKNSDTTFEKTKDSIFHSVRIQLK